jgi:hypothetical protein
MSVVTVTATVEASNVPPRVRLDVADTGAPAFATVNITRLDPNGETVPVRTTDGNPLPMSAGAGIVYDYEMQYGASVTYSSQETPANVTTPVVVPETRIWLISPGVPAVSTPIVLRPGSLVEETFPVSQGVFWPMGRANAVVVNTGNRHGSQSSLTCLTTSTAEYLNIKELVADAGVLLLNIPAGLDYGFPASYIAVSDIKAQRFSDKLVGEQIRYVTLPFVTVDRPAGGSQSQRTLADLLAFPSLGSLMDKYADFASLLAGP